MLFMPSWLGFGYFVVAGLIGSFGCVAWDYFTAKRVLGDAVAPAGAEYIGRRLNLATKVALVFIGTFVMSSLVLVELVSSKVATTLEKEFVRALQVLARVHDTQKKTISLGFQGNGKRTVRVGMSNVAFCFNCRLQWFRRFR